MNDTAPLPDRRPLAGVRIFTVDDNVDCADTTAALLRMMGAEVRIAYSAPQFLKAMHAEPPDFALVDVGMPQMDGYEVARRVKRDMVARHTVLVALTGWSAPRDVAASGRAGFDHHMVKPLDLTKLQAIIKAHMR